MNIVNGCPVVFRSPTMTPLPVVALPLMFMLSMESVRTRRGDNCFNVLLESYKDNLIVEVVGDDDLLSEQETDSLNDSGGGKSLGRQIRCSPSSETESSSTCPERERGEDDDDEGRGRGTTICLTV